MSALDELVELPVESDPFPVLYRRYQPRLCRLAASRFPQEDCEDIAQEAMYRLLRTFDRFDSRRDPWPYLSTICINVGKDMVERGARVSRWSDANVNRPASPAADESSLAWEGERWVQEVLNHLPEGPRRALALLALEEMTISEIARLMGRSDLAVRQLLFRARREARALLTGLHTTETALAIDSRRPQ